MRDYSIVVGVASVERSDIKECNQQPVTGPGRSLLGYLDVEAATKSVEQNQVRLEEPLDRVINRFERRKRYTRGLPLINSQAIFTYSLFGKLDSHHTRHKLERIAKIFGKRKFRDCDRCESEVCAWNCDA